MAKVIVFGPTGGVGSAAALSAHQLGAKVVLAMRDTSKTVPGLTSELEKSGGFERVQADLMQPDTVGAAVTKTGAKRAFFYLAMASQDHMRATVTALKNAGIETAVFLSSCSVPHGVGLRDISPAEIIPYLHASVEAELHDIFGPTGYVALRGGAFATNLLQFKQGIAQGEVSILNPDFPIDGVDPADIGRIGGAVLANGPHAGQREVYVYGPQVIPQSQAIQKIASVLGKKVTISPQTVEQAVEGYQQSGMPEPIAKYLASVFSGMDWPRYQYDESAGNIKAYTGKPGVTFDEYARDHKALFS